MDCVNRPYNARYCGIIIFHNEGYCADRFYDGSSCPYSCCIHLHDDVVFDLNKISMNFMILKIWMYL